MNIRSGLLRPCADPRTIVLDIIDGKRWVASSIVNNHFRQHCRMLGRLFKGEPEIYLTLRQSLRRLLAVIADRSGMFREEHPSRLPLVPILLRFAAYSTEWRREPEDWLPDPGVSARDHWRSLLEHLFSAGYSLPEFFANAWLTPGKLRHIERDWYCHVAAGNSIRSAPGMFASVSARAAHLLQQAPSQLSVLKALRWAQLTALGLCDGMIEAVMKSSMAGQFGYDEVWLPLLEKIASTPRFEPEAFGPVVDMIGHEIATVGSGSASRLLSAPASELKRRARRLWNQLLKMSESQGAVFHSPKIQRSGVRLALSTFARREWPTLPGSNGSEILIVDGECWKVDQLTTHLQLMTEGTRMGNCVSTYWAKCWSGKFAIFSVREWDRFSDRVTPRITFEVDLEGKRIRQAERRWNHRIDIREEPVIQSWLKRNRRLIG